MRYFLSFIILIFQSNIIFSQEPVSGKFFYVGESQYKITYFSPSNLNFTNNNIRRLVIVLHGNNRTAEQRQNAIIQAANSEDKYLETLIISPHFIGTPEIVANNLDDYHLYWSGTSWMDGSSSSSSGAYPRDESFSSFEVMDDIITQIVYGEKFPNLSQIILTGFSGGGQFMNRYAASNRIQEGLEQEYNMEFKYLVASPSSYLYFNDERRVEGTTDQFEKPNISNCGTYNNYKYGLQQMNQYMKYYHVDTLKNRYKRRNISYGICKRDNNPNSSSLDDTCPAMFQGDHRLERATIYNNYLKHYFGDLGDNHKLYITNGVGHDSFTFYNKSDIRPILFPVIKNEPNNDPLGVEDDIKITIFPSVGSKQLFITGEFKDVPRMAIYDINGKKIYNFRSSRLNSSKFSINTSNLEDGLYIIFFDNFGILNPKRKKFVIINQ